MSDLHFDFYINYSNKESKNKNVRNNIFEFLCSLLITDRVKGIPEIDLDDNLPF